MGLFSPDDEEDIKAIRTMMEVCCADWNQRFGESSQLVVGMAGEEEEELALRSVLSLGGTILQNHFPGVEKSDAFKKIATFLVVSCIHPFLRARSATRGGLYDHVGSIPVLRDFQARFMVDSLWVLFYPFDQETEAHGPIALDRWSGFPSKELYREFLTALTGADAVGYIVERKGLRHDPQAVAMHVLAVSLVLKALYCSMDERINTTA